MTLTTSSTTASPTAASANSIDSANARSLMVTVVLDIEIEGDALVIVGTSEVLRMTYSLHRVASPCIYDDIVLMYRDTIVDEERMRGDIEWHITTDRSVGDRSVGDDDTLAPRYRSERVDSLSDCIL